MSSVERVPIAVHRRPRTLDMSTIGVLRDAIQRTAPSFGPRIASARIEEIEVPFFTRVHVLEVASALPAPARILYCALAQERAHVLTGQLNELRAICRADPPAGMDDADHALVFLNLAVIWTVDETGELRIGSFDQLPLHDADAPRVEELRAALAARITPPNLVALDDGFRLEYWCVARSRLLRRSIAITTSGVLDASMDVIASVPVPPGNVWSRVDGRLVPTR